MNRKREQILIFVFGAFAAFIFSILFYIGYIKFFKNSESFPIKVLQNEKTDVQKVIVVKGVINKGEKISEPKIILEERRKKDLPNNCIIDPQVILGKETIIKLEPNIIITDDMISSPDNTVNPDERLKDYELSAGLIAGLAEEGDYVDIEYIMSTGRTYTVASKKRIEKKIDNKVVIKVDMNERQNINSAYASMKKYGGNIGAVLYIDEFQPASEVTYLGVEGIDDVILGQE